MPRYVCFFVVYVDAAAREMGIPDPEMRRRNFISPAAFPYRTPGGYVFDSGEFENVVVAQILASDKHPNADKLSVCRVADGKGERQIPRGGRPIDFPEVDGVARARTDTSSGTTGSARPTVPANRRVDTGATVVTPVTAAVPRVRRCGS